MHSAIEVSSPSQVLAEELQSRGWKLEDLSDRSGLSIQELCNPFPITQQTAQGFAQAFGTSDEFWLSLQFNYDRWQEYERFWRSRTIAAAMARNELTEEEAYFILRFAGKLGYTKAIRRLSNPWHVLRKWFVWVGGWENTELGQWDRGKPAWELFRNGKLQNPAPISFFGHRITIQSRWLTLVIGSGYLTFLFPSHVKTCYGRVYWSPNGTPHHPQARFFMGKKPDN